MKSRHIIYPAVILLLALLPTARYYVSTPGINDCMTHYVQQMKYSNNTGYLYNIEGLIHIEPSNSQSTRALSQYIVGEAHGCIISGENLYSSFNNTIYCSVTYLIQNAPMSSKYKEPLALMKYGRIDL